MRDQVPKGAPGSSPTRKASGGRAYAMALAAALAALAYYPLLLPSSDLGASRNIEDWFFMPAHGSAGIILALSAWLLYRRFRGLKALPAASGVGVGAVSALLFGVALAFWAGLTGAVDLLVLSLFANGIGFTLALRGTPGLRFTALPLAVVLLALPLPGVIFNEIVFQLQLFTAQWAGWLLHQLGFVAHVRSDLILRPEDTFAIVEGCSGMRSLEALFLLAILVVDSFGRRGMHAVLIVALSPFVAFLLNGFRVLTLIFNPHSEIIAIHNLQGVMVLLGGLVVLVVLDLGLEKVFPKPVSTPREAPGPARPRVGVPTSRAYFAVFASLVCCALFALVLVPYGDSSPRLPALRARVVPQLEAWSWTPIQTDREYLGQTHFADSIEGVFSQQGQAIEVFVGLGDPRRRNRSFVSPKTAYPGSGWLLLAEGQGELLDPHLAFEWRLLRSGAERVLSYRWHRGVGSHALEALAGASGLDHSPLRPASRWNGLVVRISTTLEGPGETGLEAARERLDGFAVDFVPALEALEESLRGKDFS